MPARSGRVDAPERDRLLTGLLPSPWLRETAATVSFVRRPRQIDPVTFLGGWVVGFGTGVPQRLASLRRAYEPVSGDTLVPVAFYDRFTPAGVAFLRAYIARGLVELIRHTRVAVADRLHAFRDRVGADGTIVRLHDPLAARFRGVKNARRHDGSLQCSWNSQKCGEA